MPILNCELMHAFCPSGYDRQPCVCADLQNMTSPEACEEGPRLPVPGSVPPAVFQVPKGGVGGCDKQLVMASCLFFLILMLKQHSKSKFTAGKIHCHVSVAGKCQYVPRAPSSCRRRHVALSHSTWTACLMARLICMLCPSAGFASTLQAMCTWPQQVPPFAAVIVPQVRRAASWSGQAGKQGYAEAGSQRGMICAVESPGR